jgi:hypothetical protein
MISCFWQVGGILTLSGGTPVNIGACADGGLRKTVHATGISPIPENQRVAQFWNIAAFDANHPSLREAFNATHHPNWNAPSIDARNSAPFSKVVSDKTMRENAAGPKAHY